MGHTTSRTPTTYLYQKRKIEVLVCRSGSDDGDTLWWVNKQGRTWPVEDDDRGWRVAQQSGSLRVLESLLSFPPTPLKRQEMERENLADLNSRDVCGGESARLSLNLSLQRVVDTVVNPNTAFLGLLANL